MGSNGNSIISCKSNFQGLEGVKALRPGFLVHTRTAVKKWLFRQFFGFRHQNHKKKFVLAIKQWFNLIKHTDANFVRQYLITPLLSNGIII